jgi:hypothetical protein
MFYMNFDRKLMVEDWLIIYRTSIWMSDILWRF